MIDMPVRIWADNPSKRGRGNIIPKKWILAAAEDRALLDADTDYYLGDLVRELIEAIENEHCDDCGCAFDPHPETVKAIAALEEEK